MSGFVGHVVCVATVACEYGMVHVVSESGGPRGKDYCILYNPQWAHLPHDLSKASLLQLRDWTASVLCSPPDLPAKGFSNQIPLVARGNCTFYEKVRLAQGGGARGLLIVSRETLGGPRGLETGVWFADPLVPSPRQSFGRSVRAALYAPNEPMLDYNMVIIFVMAVGTVALGGYWAGSRDVRKRYMKHKRDDGPEKQEDEAVDVTPVMICVFVVMCCSMLVLLYYFYDQLGAGTLRPVPPLPGLGSPVHPLAGFHLRRRRGGGRGPWAWILQDALGVAFCLYMLKTIRLPTFKVRVPRRWGRRMGGGSGTAVTRDAAGPTRLLPAGLLVAYCHRFDIQVQSSRVYFVACTVAYGIGLLVTFMALALMQRGQPALLYLVPCTLMISCALALWRRELGMFWTGSGFAVNTRLL
uniref:PA domain-containing protein n=1 Tax=Panthera tigris altaica TaxID=74533 RepID=A0A8C9K1V8_PANTA